IIDEQARRIAELEADLRGSEAERQRLRRENEKLKEELDAARRAVYRQAAPFSRGTRVAQPRRPGRKPRAAYGVRTYRRRPAHIDETYEAPLPAHCPVRASCARGAWSCSITRSCRCSGRSCGRFGCTSASAAAADGVCRA